MKKTRRKQILRGIWGNLNRFFSILFIVAIGAGFMAGLAATSPDMYDTAGDYLTEQRLYDLDIRSPWGLMDDDTVSKAQGVDGVEAIVPARVWEMVLEREDSTTYTTRVLGTLGPSGESDINRPVLKEGRFPEKPGECVVESYMGKYGGNPPVIGDVLRISASNERYDEICADSVTETMTVVGTVNSPLCIGVVSDPTNVGSGSIGVNVFALREQFSRTDYTDLFVKASYPVEQSLFEDGAVKMRERLQEDCRRALRTDAARKVDAYIKKMENALQPLQMVEGLCQQVYLREAEASRGLLANRTKRQALAEKLSDDGLKNALRQVEDGWARELSVPEVSFGTEALSQTLQEQKQQLQGQNYMVRTMDTIACVESYAGNVGKVAALSKVFPVFFFLVALLVALTTMTRLVEESRTQIGTLKALGFRNGQVLAEYMLFSLSASVLGCVVGFAVGFQLFPRAINSAYSMLYILPTLKAPVRADIAAWVAFVTIGSIVVATLVACWNEFVSCPAELMVPKAPAAGKRIWLEKIPFLWKHIPFTGKVTCRNLFRYKKRFFMTILGVAGCSALLLAGFGLRDSVRDIVGKQYGEINQSELMLVLDSQEEAQKDAVLQDFLQDTKVIRTYMAEGSDDGWLEYGTSNTSITLIVPERLEDLDTFIRLRERKSGKTLELEQGVVVTEKLCEEKNIRVGDSVKLQNGKGMTAAATVTGIAENYISSIAYMSQETYQELYGEPMELDVILCRLADTELETDKLTTMAMKGPSVVYARSVATLKQSFADSVKSIDGVIWVLIVAAGLLCAVVLYNLTNVNICERRKELATIRVLGFHERETEKYIFRETNILSLLGAVVGLAVGVVLHRFVVQTIEVDNIMFGRNIYPLSYLYAVLITMAFAVAVNRVMRHSIRRVDMVEAMKAND